MKSVAEPLLSRARALLLLGVLLCAQLFSQLHALEHLQPDVHEAEPCMLCLLSAELAHPAGPLALQAPPILDIMLALAPAFAAHIDTTGSYRSRGPPAVLTHT